MTQRSNKLKVSLISALLVFGLAAGPVQADHEHQSDNVIAPLATLLVLGSLLHYNQGYEYKYSKRRHGYGQHYGHRHSHRARSYSYEGYNRKSRHAYKSDRRYKSDRKYKSDRRIKSDRGFKSKRDYKH